MGSGQAAIAVIKSERHYVEYEIDEEYVKLAEERNKKFALTSNIPASFKFEEKIKT